MFVCIYVYTISYGTACMCGIYLYPASLTLVFAVMSAPILRRSATVSVWPFQAALCNAVYSFYNNRETETETERDRSGQGHTEDDILLARYGHTEEGSGRSGTLRSGYGRIQRLLTWRGDSAAEDGCLCGRTGHTADLTPQDSTPRMRCGPGTAPMDRHEARDSPPVAL